MKLLPVFHTRTHSPVLCTQVAHRPSWCYDPGRSNELERAIMGLLKPSR